MWERWIPTWASVTIAFGSSLRSLDRIRLARQVGYAGVDQAAAEIRGIEHAERLLNPQTKCNTVLRCCHGAHPVLGSPGPGHGASTRATPTHGQAAASRGRYPPRRNELTTSTTIARIRSVWNAPGDWRIPFVDSALQSAGRTAAVLARHGWSAVCVSGPPILMGLGRALAWFERRVLLLVGVSIALAGFLAWPVEGVLVGEHIVARYLCWNGVQEACVVVRQIGRLAPPAP